MSDTKVCATCKVRKRVGQFPVSGQPYGGGYRAHCTECFNAARRKGTPHGKPAGVLPRQESLQPLVEHRLKQRVAELETRNRELLAALSSADEMTKLRRAVANQRVTPIRPRERSQVGRRREATALACASDWHIEESVHPDQVAGRNRYDLTISRRRMERFFERTRWAIDLNRQAFTVRDLVLWLGGDFITGYLHDDNRESNLLPPVKAIALAQTSIAAGIRHLLSDKQLERIVVPCTDGNHGRLTEYTRSSTRVANSIEWLLYTNLAAEFKTEPRVEFVIATGEHLYFDVYGRTIRFLHGDTVKYAGGVGGITIPVRKAIDRWQSVRTADLTVMGHWHQYLSTSDFIINGSLIGYSPYALTVGARFEPPTQAFCMLDPVRFKSVSIPLWVSEATDDELRKAS